MAQADVEMGLPCRIGDYTDFYASIHHATSVGKQFRPDNPLLPNYKWVPIGYHGRASSIGVSGQPIRRPSGQFKGADDATHRRSARRGASTTSSSSASFIARSAMRWASRCRSATPKTHLFGLALLNDWTARDIQGWEYQPLGPFLSKNFATTLSPWIVTLEALAPFRAPFARPAGDPAPLPYLDSRRQPRDGRDRHHARGLAADRERCATRGHAGDRLSQSNFRDATGPSRSSSRITR